MVLDKALLFLVEPGHEWIGGVYYVRNILKTLSYAPWVESSSIHVLVRPEFRELFESLEGDFSSYTLHERRTTKPRWERLASLLLKRLGYIYDSQVAKLSRRIRADVVFPLSSFPFFNASGRQVHWFPDFQHLHLPRFFAEDELARRAHRVKAIAAAKSSLILSSRSAEKDWNRCAPSHRGKVYILPFISDIESELVQLTDYVQRESLGKFGLWEGDAPRDYFYIPNQFWQHKNHAIVLDAFDRLKALGQPLPLVVCTGSTSDHRSKDHASALLARTESSNYAANFRILSMVGRLQQLSIMRNARAVLQPSLFEGWNTGVQEAVRLGRPLVMSDLDVHREQCPTGASFFDPTSANELAKILSQYPEPTRFDDDALRTKNIESARAYAEGARELLCP